MGACAGLSPALVQCEPVQWTLGFILLVEAESFACKGAPAQACIMQSVLHACLSGLAGMSQARPATWSAVGMRGQCVA